MLGKLIKYEWKSTYKILLLINAAQLLITIIARFMDIVSIEKLNSGQSLLASFFFLAYILFIIACNFANIFILIIRFYRTMYSDQGYLTHTLPVKTNSVLVSKTFVFFIWSFISTIIAITGLCILLKANPFSIQGTAFLEGLAASYGTSPVIVILYLLLYMCLSILYMIGSFYLAMSIGSLFGNHKVPVSILAYFALYVIQQIASLILLFSSSYFRDMMERSEDASYYPPTFFLSFMNKSEILTVVLTIIFFVGVWFINTRKLNLE